MTTTLVLDPYDYDFHDDPYPIYARLRDEQPLYRNEERDFWALSRYDDVVGAFKDSARFSSRNGVSLDPGAWGPHARRTMSFLAMDPPEHTRLRGLVARGFSPRRVAELEPRIRQLTLCYLEQALEGSEFDMIGDLAGRLPMDVVSELLGVPAADRARLRRLSDTVMHREDGLCDVPAAGMEAALELVVYYTELLAERRHHPTADLTSALTQVEVDGERLADEEIVSFLFLMVVAGNETTTKLLGNAWYWAWRFPDQQQAALAGGVAPAAWAEETLRFDTSSHLLARVTRTPVELHGTVVPAGERMLLLVGSANRDGRVFPDGDKYDLGRDCSRLASFGVGRHFCLGAALARLEARVALEELRRHVAAYEIDETRAIRVHSSNVRGFSALPTTVTAR